ncbi:MAG: hypothetical protein Q4C67_01165, partial [Deinococcus sp.]|nr:hypothetical protein [Deinococcus sp.]
MSTHLSPQDIRLRPFVPADASAAAQLQTAACREQWIFTATDLLAQSGTRWVAAAQGKPIASARLYPFGPGAE